MISFTVGFGVVNANDSSTASIGIVDSGLISSTRCTRISLIWSWWGSVITVIVSVGSRSSVAGIGFKVQQVPCVTLLTVELVREVRSALFNDSVLALTINFNTFIKKLVVVLIVVVRLVPNYTTHTRLSIISVVNKVMVISTAELNVRSLAVDHSIDSNHYLSPVSTLYTSSAVKFPTANILFFLVLNTLPVSRERVVHSCSTAIATVFKEVHLFNWAAIDHTSVDHVLGALLLDNSVKVVACLTLLTLESHVDFFVFKVVGWLFTESECVLNTIDFVSIY